MRTFFYILSAIGAILSCITLVGTLAAAQGAPQEASGAAIAACIAIIPYVFARSIDSGWSPNAIKQLLEEQVEQNREIILLLKKSNGMLANEDKAKLYK